MLFLNSYWKKWVASPDYPASHTIQYSLLSKTMVASSDIRKATSGIVARRDIDC